MSDKKDKAVDAENANTGKPTVKAERQSSWSPRTYFIIDNNTEDADLKLANGLEFNSEEDAKQFIVANGVLDTPYFIGYKVTSVKPVTKTAKIKLT